MANEGSTAESGGYRSAQPIVHKIGPSDIRYALAKGLDDFKAMPTHLAFLAVIYPLVTLVGARTAAGYDVLPLVFPLLTGYTLIGPLIATGMYELSRRREQGLEVSRMHSFEAMRSPAIRSIIALGLVLMVIYFVWLFAAHGIYNQFFGTEAPESIGGFFTQVFATSSGWGLIIVGCGAGFIFASVVFTLSVVSFPLLLDQNVSVLTAVETSTKAVLKNPVTMAMWGVTVAGTLFLGSLPFFVGLGVALPLLGHATWHLYRKTVEP